MMVQHHTKYIELHGVDEVVEMSKSDHGELHRRLRREGKCDVPVDELHKISTAAHQRSYYAEHGDHAKAYHRAYYIAHRDHLIAKRAAYREEHRDQINADKRASYAARKLKEVAE